MCFLAKSRLQLFCFSQWENTLPSGTIKFTRACFPAFQSSVKTLLWSDVPFLEKRCQGDSVLWVLTAIPVVTLIRWNFTVRWLPSKKLEACFLFQKLNIVNKAVVMKKKMKKYVFLASLRLQLCSLYWEYFFCHKFPVPRFTKSCFPVVSELCKTS